jgi:hypothetical protein
MDNRKDVKDLRSLERLPTYETPRMISTSEEAMLRDLAPVHGVTSPIPDGNEIP